MKILGSFIEKKVTKQLVIDFDELNQEINDLDDYIITKDKNNKIKFVLNKVCDHAGGRLIVRDDKAVCPLHNWQLNLDNLKYEKVNVCKKQANYTLFDNRIEIDDSTSALHNCYKPDVKGSMKLRWINHACIHIEVNGKTLVTDPWLMGTAFLTGWWLQTPSPEDAITLLENADFIYISHNHTDHLHEETLSLLPRNKEIFTANFKSNSSRKSLESLGFTNVVTPDFNSILELSDGLQISILQAGDFRDDSGIYICANGHEILLTVDSNALNNFMLPENVDLLMTSFAGGASGFPLNYDIFSQTEKDRLSRKHRKALLSLVDKYFKTTNPKYYIPYAGMFNESAQRDRYIKSNNPKNSIQDLRKLANKNKVDFLEPDMNVIFNFDNNGLNVEPFLQDKLLTASPECYIKQLKADYNLDIYLVMEYFNGCDFSANQIVQIIPCDDDYIPKLDLAFYLDFNTRDFSVISIDEVIACKDDYNVMTLRIREEILMKVVTDYLPWEDFTVGFQMRAVRSPNEYESDFWFYFTNVYIGKEQKNKALALSSVY